MNGLTSIIDGLNLQFRQITTDKPSFTNDDSLRRLLYLASQRIIKHWHVRRQNWDMVLSQLEIMFSDWADRTLAIELTVNHTGIHAYSAHRIGPPEHK